MLKHKPTIQQVMSFVGTVESCVPGVLTAYLHKYNLEVEKNDALKFAKGKLGKTMTLSPAALQEVHWWVHESNRYVKPLVMPPTNRLMQSDASGYAWGACIPAKPGVDTVETQGRWSVDELEENINVKELLAAFYGLKAFFSNDVGSHILLQIDNVTAVAYINKMGGTKAERCREVAQSIWHWALAHGVWLTAEYLPGEQNNQADRLSRKLDDNLEWQLKPKIFQAICEQLQVHPDIDLFASKLNTQLPVYMSFLYDEGAVAVNAFHHSWNMYDLPYIFCPFSVIPRVLQRLAVEGGQALMVVPLWPTAAWFATWAAACVKGPVLLPQQVDLLRLVHEPTKRHPLRRQMRMACAVVCPKSSHKQQHSPKTRSRLSWGPSDLEPGSSMPPIWPAGMNIQTLEGLIPLTPLTRYS